MAVASDIRVTPAPRRAANTEPIWPMTLSAPGDRGTLGDVAENLTRKIIREHLIRGLSRLQNLVGSRVRLSRRVLQASGLSASDVG